VQKFQISVPKSESVEELSVDGRTVPKGTWRETTC